jgi:ubiquitin-protein ligase E3 A
VQLTVGCGTACNHQLCASHPQFEKISNQRAAIMAIQLASHPRGLYCPRILDSCISSDSVIQSLLSSPKSSPAHSRASSASSLIADNLSVNSDLLLKSPARTKSKLALDDFSADDHKSPEITQNVTFHCSVLLNSINEPVDSKILHTSVRMVFSSTDSLGQCFLDQNSSFGPKIQFFSLNSLLAHFVENDRKLSCVNELCNSIELLLVVAHAHIQKYVPDDYFLRSLLILLEIPFSVNDTFHSLFSGICKLIRNLRSKAKNTLIQWLSTYETAHFCKILEKFKGFIENNSITSITDELVGAIRALGILNQANEARSQNIAISEFYVSRLSLQLDFKNEYRNWKASKIPKSGSNFSFFNYPFLFDPLSKSRFLHIHAMFQMSKEYEQAHVNQALLMKAQQILVRENAESQKLKAAIDPFLLLEVRRECLIDDVCNALGQKISELKKPLKVRFIGSGEQGMDQGGVQKEFFQISIEKMLDPMYGLFVYDSETRISWFNSGCEDHMRNYEYFGILFGLALYNGVMLGLKFPSVLYRKILNEPITLEDIETSFPV